MQGKSYSGDGVEGYGGSGIGVVAHGAAVGIQAQVTGPGVAIEVQGRARFTTAGTAVVWPQARRVSP